MQDQTIKELAVKKGWTIVILGILSVSLIGCGDPCKDNVFTGIGDSIATFGKKDLDKEAVLAERKAGRAAECAKKMGGDMKKSLGF